MTRRERLEAKIEKRREWAESREAKATSLRAVDAGGSWCGYRAKLPACIPGQAQP